MDTTLYFTVISTLILLGALDALHDNVTFYEIKSPFYFGGWHAKYSKPLKVVKDRFTCWWYFGLIKPKYKERFPFSTTILVFMTDSWHFYKWLKWSGVEFMISVLLIKIYMLSFFYIVPLILVQKIIRGIAFNIIFEKFKK